MTSPSDALTLQMRVVVDPRIKQRWVDVRRSAGRRRLQLIVAAAAAAAVIGAGVGALYTPLVGVRSVRIVGAGSLPAAQLTRIAGVGHQPMIDVRPSRVVARLEAVPIVGQVRVERLWPSTVRIQLTLRAPVAQTQIGLRTFELDATGRLLAEVAAPVPGRPFVNGLSSATEALGAWVATSAGPNAPANAPVAALLSSPATPIQAALALCAALPPIAASRVEAIDVTGATLQAVVTTGAGASTATVLFGDATQLNAKLTALVTVLDQVSLTGISQVDLRVPYRPTLTPQP
jgi:cell division septal protein FtsQ